MSGTKGAKPNVEPDSRHQLGRQLSVVPGVAVVADRAVRLVGLAADEDLELGFRGVVGPTTDGTSLRGDWRSARYDSTVPHIAGSMGRVIQCSGN